MSSESAATPAETTETRKTCPLCGATVFPQYRKCQFCGSLLEQTETVEAQPERQSNDNQWISYAILAMPVLITLSLLIFVIPLHAMHSPFSRMGMVLGIGFMTSAALAAVDAQQLGAGRTKNAGPYPPAVWYLFFLFLLPVAFPLYVKQRAQAGHPDRTKIAIALAALLTITILLTAIITSRKQSRWHADANRNAISLVAAI